MPHLLRFAFFVPFVVVFCHYSPPVQAQQVEEKASEAVFSGPQIGEPLSGFKVTSLVEDTEGKVLNPVADAKGQPIVLIFIHELTRPGFGLMRAVTKFSAERKDKGMNVAVVFLTDDATATAKWSKNVQRLFSDNVQYGMFMDGKEGPGAYGLNRNVIVTVLVGNQGMVTGNFALVQPQLQVDGPEILKSIAAVSGGGKVPSMDQLEARYAGRSRMTPGKQNAGAGNVPRNGRGDTRRDAELATLLRGVINKQATNEEVRRAASQVEEYVAENEKAKNELARIAAAVVNSGRLKNYGNSTVQEVLREWCQKYKTESRDNLEPTKATPKSSSNKE
ncbi:MAG: hypothetical protein CBD74_14135 [Saprospirales bacterium TMED214]|nr:MAG: hypothetical protein CBD74_14135 [Saprospirales bacterium TMED214]